MLSRLALIDNMNAVAPALAESNAIPVLAHFWFTGKTLMAFNGVIGISVPCETEFKGGAPRTLLRLLETTSAKDVDLKTEDGNMQVRSGKSKFNVAVMPLDDFADHMASIPKLPKERYDIDGEKFLEAMSMCLRSIGNEKVRADMMGTTIIREKGELFFFSYDRVSVSHASMTGDMDAKRVIVPAEWCKQAIALFGKDPDFDMDITEDSCLLSANGVKLWATTLAPDDVPRDFFDIVDGQMSKAGPKVRIDIPDNLSEILERAKIIGNSGVAKTKTRVKAKGGTMTFESKNDAGEVFDNMDCGRHPDIAVAIDASVVQGGCDLDQIAFTDTAVVMAKNKGRLLYLVSLVGED